jgi:hypothetical protein
MSPANEEREEIITLRVKEQPKRARRKIKIFDLFVKGAFLMSPGAFFSVRNSIFEDSYNSES